MKTPTTLLISLLILLSCFDSQGQTKSAKVLIPNDLFQIPEDTYIGISDAGTDSATAYHQACMRALSMAALHHGRGKGMGDYYTKTNKNSVFSKYEELYRLQMALDWPLSSIKEVKSIYLGNKEYVVFLRLDSTLTKNSTSVHFQSNAEIYFHGLSIDKQESLSKKMYIKSSLYKDLDRDKHIESVEYTSKNNVLSDFKISFDKKKSDTYPYKYFYLYEDGDPATPENELLSYHYTTDGLWIALIEGVYKQLSAACQQYFLEVQNVGDAYQAQEEKINRQVGRKFYFDAAIKQIYYIDNKLAVDMDIKLKQ